MDSMAILQLFARVLIALSIICLYLRYLHKRPQHVRTKRTEITCGLLLLSFLLFGCMPSLHPLYTDDTLIFDEKLVGKWYDDEGNCWAFSQSDQKAYALRVIGEEGKQAVVEAHLVEIGSHRYLDLFPSEEWKEHAFGYTLMPVHNFMRVQLSDPNLQLQWVMFHDLIEEDPNILKHEMIPEANGEYSEIKFIITAQTEDIQRVMMQYPEDIIGEGTGMLKRCPSLFSQKDILFEDKLLGQWSSKNEERFVSLIRSENNGYKIKYREKGEDELSFDGVLYRYHGQCILGLYTKTPSSNEMKAGLDLIPDLLLAIDVGDNELKVWHLSWEDVEDFKVKDAIYNFDALDEPDTVFKRRLNESNSSDEIK